MSSTIENFAQSLIVEFRELLTPYLANAVSLVQRELGPVEAAAELVQQLVLEEIRIDAEPLVVSFWRELELSGHALSWLPLHLSGIESWEGLPPGAFQRSAGNSFNVDGESDAIEIPAPELRTRMQQAFSHWGDASNGLIEAREFISRSEVISREVVGTCVQRALSCPSVSIDAVDPGHAFLHLSESSRSDGAYTSGRVAAYGRLQTWKLLQAALGCDANASVDRIDETARISTWFIFSCPWFYDVAWDCGVAIAREDRHVIVLAATDTD